MFNIEGYKPGKPRTRKDECFPESGPSSGNIDGLRNHHFLAENIPPYIDNFVTGAERSRKLVKLPNGKEIRIFLFEDENEVLVEYKVCKKGIINISDKKDFKLEGSKDDLPIFVYVEGKILEIVIDENRKVAIYEHNISDIPKELDSIDLKEFVKNHSNEDATLKVPDL